jgi:hypothetical protein
MVSLTIRSVQLGAEAVRSSPNERLLHLAHRAELTLERAKLLLGGPEQAPKLADEIGHA